MPIDRPRMMADLEAAKQEQRRCMGGVDPAGCVAASKRVTALRNALRDDPAMIAHLAVCLTTPLSVGRRR